MKLQSTTIRFVLLFAVCFIVLSSAFEALRGTRFEKFLVEDLILTPTVWVINLAPPHDVRLVDRVITSPGSRLNVIRGCDGIELFILLAAGIVAFPATWRRRLTGLLAGAVLAYALSVSRLAALHYILRYDRNAWEALHGLVLPLAPLILLTLFFAHWISPSRPARTSESHAV